MNYGALTLVDVSVLEEVLSKYRNRPLRFLEIGVHTGATARGIRDYCEANGISLEYWGIDLGVQWDGQIPFVGANMVKGDSAEVADSVPSVFDVVLSDGCHCANHVIIEVALYGEKVAYGGFLLHHDIAPHVQQTMKDPHGPNTPRFHNSVNEALEMIHFPWHPWIEYIRRFDPDSKWGGMVAWRRG